VPRAFPPERRLDDVELMKGDAVVLVLFALAQKAAAESFAPSFPGWLAPVSLDAVSFLSFLVETGVLVAAWLGASAAVGAYEIKAVGKDSEEGEMRNAVNGAAKSWFFFCGPAYFGVANARDALLLGNLPGGTNGLGSLPNSFPVSLTLSLVLLVMLSWRAYVKVIGLMGWWRAGREKNADEDEAYVYLRNAQTFAVGLALSSAVADFATHLKDVDYPSF
jgi:hypothetical protein